MDRKIIDIDASRWCHILDIYTDVFKHVGAPDWHGKSLDALIDSMIFGGINELEPPYTLRFHGVESLPDDIIKRLRTIKEALEVSRIEQKNTVGIDADVEFELA